MLILALFVAVYFAETAAITSCELRRQALLEGQRHGENVANDLSQPCPLGAPRPKPRVIVPSATPEPNPKPTPVPPAVVAPPPSRTPTLQELHQEMLRRGFPVDPFVPSGDFPQVSVSRPESVCLETEVEAPTETEPECYPIQTATSSTILREVGDVQLSVQHAARMNLLGKDEQNSSEEDARHDFCFEVCQFNFECRKSPEISFCLDDGTCHGLFADNSVKIHYQVNTPVCVASGIEPVFC